jgi:hypothetical protein
MSLKEEHLEDRQYHGWARDFDFEQTLKIHKHFERFTAGSTEEKHIPNVIDWNELTGRVRYC